MSFGMQLLAVTLGATIGSFLPLVIYYYIIPKFKNKK